LLPHATASTAVIATNAKGRGRDAISLTTVLFPSVRYVNHQDCCSCVVSCFCRLLGRGHLQAALLAVEGAFSSVVLVRRDHGAARSS
jgi:hypothetical protein